MSSIIARATRSDVGRHGALVFGSLLSLNLATYVFYALAARSLGVVAYGTFMSIVSLTLIVTAPATVAQFTLAKLVAEVSAGGNQSAVAGIARRISTAGPMLAAVVLLVGLVLSGPLSALVRVSDPVLIPVAAVCSAFAIVIALQRGVFQGARCFSDLGASMFAEAGARVVAIGPLARLYGIRGGLCALLVSLAVPLALSWIRTRMLWPHARAIGIDRRRFLNVAMHTGAGFLALTVMLYFDVVLVRHYFDAASAGLYSAASLVGRAIYSGVAFIPVVLIPNVVARRVTRGPMRVIIVGGVAFTALASGCATGLVLLWPERVAQIVSGPAFNEAAPLLLPYAVAASLLAGASVTVAVRVGLHRFEHVVPLATIACGEIVAAAIRHRTVWDVLWIILVGHGLALVASALAGIVRRGDVPAVEELHVSAS